MRFRRLTILTLMSTGLIIATSVMAQNLSRGGFHLLIFANGPVRLKQPNWPDFREIKPIKRLKNNDILFLSQGSKATILCQNLSRLPVAAGGQSAVQDVCPSRERKLRDGRIVPPGPRSPIPKRVPYVIAPRNTNLLESQPTLKWKAVSGETQYRVTLLGPEGKHWEETITGTEIVYPGDPPLEPGITYRLEIVGEKSSISSQTEDSLYGGFKLLKPTEVKAIRADLISIEQAELTPRVNALVLAHFYRGQNLNQTALSLLEKAVANGANSAEIFELQGDIYYWQVGLTGLAQESYEKALSQTSPEDWWLKAKVLESLGDVYLDIERKDAAKKQYEEAKFIWGDEAANSPDVARLNQKINRLIR